MHVEDENYGENVVAQVLQKGYKIGVISSVNLNHATPAAFYAHQKSRIYNKEIGPIHDGNHACAHHDHGGHNDTFGIVPYLISIL